MANSKSGGTLAQLSSQLAAAVETGAQSVVALHARRRIPSSGIVWRDGLVVAASHTVRRDGRIPVTLPSGESSHATVIGRDAGTDLIALRLESSGPAPAERASSGDDRVGLLVLAIGRPGPDPTASFGIVSAILQGTRTVHGRRLDRVLRLDLSIQDGFSGGALVDADGRVLGMTNSALGERAPVALGADVVDQVLDALLNRGHVRRPYIGVAVHPVTLSGAGARPGLVILSTADDSPAGAAGLLVGDVIVTAAGHALEEPADLLDALFQTEDGGKFELVFLRGGVERTVTLNPVDRDAEKSE
jgi:S1-C subfamily serine protease